DWLAGEFIRSGWRVKNLHRLIMLSSTYQQSSQCSVSSNQYSVQNGRAAKLNTEHWSLNTNSSSAAASDPDNRFFSHMNRRRHDYETQRDALLAVAGTLDRKPGGPPADLASPRRTLYTFVNRMDVPPVMTTFDFPSPSA